MKVHKIYTESPLRNYNYFIEETSQNVIVVDPLIPAQVDAWLLQNGKKLSGIIITHNHPDHVAGFEKLMNEHGCKVYAHSEFWGNRDLVTNFIEDGDSLKLEVGQLDFIYTPGHTKDHICLLLQKNGVQESVITMDTIFNAGVGNCKNGGDPKTLFQSIEKLLNILQDDVVLYPGHDYILNNLKFTLSIEPENEVAKNLVENFQGQFDTTIGQEKNINVFFRLDEKNIVDRFTRSAATREERFIELRKLRDTW
ncbi:MBL fold metallo-hydrolase [Bacteriovorax sp. Seq25_V]|uniref:MBL fold metallo-hydrolase n=1 Tax=Bacteriovorax sp. Seq25_V TaxID=1201288 RepID=UPI00038A483E|nr:MBL fold metallo-hydrolase [Bacteriovorax sp. Seq25_V]EQC46687.1 putative hydroxyacylglutathione hydrolase [Bacteriovorax sp. Seq25_V]